MPERTEVAAARLLSLVAWIGDHPGSLVNDIAEHFGRTRKQVQRDIEVLGSVRDSLPGASLEIDWDLYAREERVAMHSTLGADVPPRLTEEEAALIIVGLQALTPILGPDLHDHVMHTALAVTRDAQAFEESLAYSPSGSDQARIDDILSALSAQVAVRFTYPHDDHDRERTIDPWNIKRFETGWTVTGWDHDAAAERTFRIDRMRDISVSDQPVTHPAAADGSPSAMVRMTCTSEARWILDAVPLSVVSDSGSEFSVDVPVWDEEWVTHFLIDIAPHVVQVEPSEWKERAARVARRARDVWAMGK